MNPKWVKYNYSRSMELEPPDRLRRIQSKIIIQMLQISKLRGRADTIFSSCCRSSSTDGSLGLHSIRVFSSGFVCASLRGPLKGHFSWTISCSQTPDPYASRTPLFFISGFARVTALAIVKAPSLPFIPCMSSFVIFQKLISPSND